MGERTYSYDANLVLSDGAAPYTATGYAQNLGADGIVDTGGNQSVTITLPSIAQSTTLTPQQARADCVLVVDLTAIKTSSSNEDYELLLVGSNDPAFGAGNVQMLGSMQFGFTGSYDILNGITTPQPAAIGGARYEIPFTTEQNNIKYQFVKLYNIIAGTTPTMTYKAFIAVLMIT